MADSPFPSESVERAAIESLHQVAPANLRGQLGLRLDRIGAAGFEPEYLRMNYVPSA